MKVELPVFECCFIFIELCFEIGLTNLFEKIKKMFILMIKSIGILHKP